MLFYVHPSSSLMVVTPSYQKGIVRYFEKGAQLFYSILEERDIHNWAKGVSYFKTDWLQDLNTIKMLNDKSNFTPSITLEGEKRFIEYF